MEKTLQEVIEQVKDDMTLDYVARIIVEVYDEVQAREIADLIIKHI